jgi:hypothetical protein
MSSSRARSRSGISRFPFTGQVNAHLDATADLGIAIPQYVFATPLLGGQLAVGAIVPVGNTRASVDTTLTVAVGPLGFTVDGGPRLRRRATCSPSSSRSTRSRSPQSTGAAKTACAGT